MGYYSEVALCIPNETYKTMMEHLAKENAETQVEVKSLLADAEKTEKDGAVMYYWSWVKWYSSYPCVGFITKFLESVESDELEEKLEYRLITIGESLDDNNDSGDFWETPFNLDIVRCISFA